MRKLTLIILILASLQSIAQTENERGTYLSIGGGYLENSATINLNIGIKVSNLSLTLSPIGVLRSENSKPYVLYNSNLGLHVGNFARVFGSYGWHPEKHGLNANTDSIQGFKYGYGVTLYKRMSWSRTFSEWSLYATVEKTGSYVIPSIGFYKFL